jgi:hypothetical protein
MRVTPIASFLLILLLQTSTRAGEPIPDLSGRWESGSWHSDTTGHKGPLRATFHQQDDGNYRVIFRGRFWGVVPFRYGVTLQVTGQQDDKVLLSGSSRLGPILGTFTYSGEASATEFQATYQSRGDHGVFLLSRGCDPSGAR